MTLFCVSALTLFTCFDPSFFLFPTWLRISRVVMFFPIDEMCLLYLLCVHLPVLVCLPLLSVLPFHMSSTMLASWLYSVDIIFYFVLVTCMFMLSLCMYVLSVYICMYVWVFRLPHVLFALFNVYFSVDVGNFSIDGTIWCSYCIRTLCSRFIIW